MALHLSPQSMDDKHRYNEMVGMVQWMGPPYQHISSAFMWHCPNHPHAMGEPLLLHHLLQEAPLWTIAAC